MSGEAAPWSLTHCRDDQYRREFVDVVRNLTNWFEPYGGFDGKDILDFGCGEGAAALGLALQHNVRRIVGIDPGKKIWRCLPRAQEQIGLEHLPPQLELFLMEPDADLSGLGKFDVVYSWSVFEHVQQDLILDRLSALHALLKPNGLMFLQTTPLYYSAWGSHTRPQVPIPWAHLLFQESLFFDKLREGSGSRAEADFLQTEILQTLNKATAGVILKAAKQAGFEIVREYRTRNAENPPAELLEIFTEDVLTTEQLVFLGVKPAASEREEKVRLAERGGFEPPVPV